MKIKFIIPILTLIFCITSCDVIDKLLTFTISDETTFSINSGFPVNSPIDVPTPEVTTNSTSEFENNNTRTDLVKDVKLVNLKLTIIYPTEKTFTFLKSVHIYISSENNDEIELASLDNINATTNTINLTCTTQKLDKYIKSNSYKLRTQITTKETLIQKIDVKANMSFKVTADPL